MLDAEMRGAVMSHLRTLHRDDESTLYRHELGLCLGETRVDVAAVNGSITGCEIKSSRDKMSRLKTQVPIYNRVVDHCILVVEEKDADRASDFLPDWWGLWLAVPTGADECVVRELRRAKANIEVDAFSTAQLLWRDEALAVLRAHEEHRGLSRATRFEIWDRLVSALSLAQLQAEVRDRLRARREWPGG